MKVFESPSTLNPKPHPTQFCARHLQLLPGGERGGGGGAAGKPVPGGDGTDGVLVGFCLGWSPKFGKLPKLVAFGFGSTNPKAYPHNKTDQYIMCLCI